MKLPLINEEIALLIRYEIEIDPKVRFFLFEINSNFGFFLKLLEQHKSLSRLWDNYKYLLDESITSLKHLKVKKFELILLMISFNFRKHLKFN
jgi:hypothetical protein